MIGQSILQNRFKEMIQLDTFPRFTILVGEEGSGKRTIANMVGRMLKAHTIVTDIGVDDIRTIIDQSYKVADKTLYIIPNADTMSLGARNALLKVTEEPPNNAYFIMTLVDENSTLATIRSRGTVYYMQSYSNDELMMYCESDGIDKVNANALCSICNTIGQIKSVKDMNLTEFLDFVTLVVDNIHTTSGSNALKLAQRVNLDGKGGYDLRLFWNAFCQECMVRALQLPNDTMLYSSWVTITCKWLESLRTISVSKVSLFDMWIFDIRRVAIEVM